MITRAHIRRQLRASGGITNVMPRQGYFLGKLVKGIGKGLKKVAGVAKQVVKSPIGRAAILGLGASYLGPKIMSGGLGGLKSSLFGSIIPGVRAAGMPSFLGETGFTKTAGLLGKLGLTKGGGSMGITGLGKMLGAGGLIGYFTSKGASEEEAKELAQDVYRGKGIGFDQIRADLNKYRSGDLSQQQMFDKNYRFLTPRNFVAAKGGRVDLQEGSLAMNKENVKQKFVSDEAGAIPKKGGGVLPSDIGKLRRSDFDTDEDYQRYLRQLNRKAMGGRIGYASGGPKGNGNYGMEGPYEGFHGYHEDGSPIRHIDLYDSMEDFLEFNTPQTKKPKKKKLKKKRAKAFGGGIMDMPMGKMKRNRAGVMERDYRDKGGFVPVGVKEKADDVPAMLSKNEFVMTADAVRGAGDGNIKKGAQRMYDLMKRNEGKVA